MKPKRVRQFNWMTRYNSEINFKCNIKNLYSSASRAHARLYSISKCCKLPPILLSIVLHTPIAHLLPIKRLKQDGKIYYLALEKIRNDIYVGTRDMAPIPLCFSLPNSAILGLHKRVFGP